MLDGDRLKSKQEWFPVKASEDLEGMHRDWTFTELFSSGKILEKVYVRWNKIGGAKEIAIR